jgi:hypothetical protein
MLMGRRCLCRVSCKWVYVRRRKCRIKDVMRNFFEIFWGNILTYKYGQAIIFKNVFSAILEGLL